jgi:ABC-2 type transport system ATP-binding protein
LSTHILPEVTMVCQRVLIINQGRIVAQDTMENLAGGSKAVMEIEVDGPPETVSAALRRIPEVASFSKEAEGRYRVEGAADVELGPAIAKSLIEANVAVRRLSKLSRTLEDIFIGVVSGEEGVS